MRRKSTQRIATRWLAALTAMAVALASGGCGRRQGAAASVDLHAGFMICNSLKETRERFDPLCAYLADVLGVKVVPHYINTGEFEKEIKKGYLQIAHSNSLLYVIFRESYGWKLTAGEKEGSHGSSTAGVIFVRSDSPVKAITDLKGKRMMFGPELAPMGFLSQYYLLLENGLDPEIDLAFYAFPRGAFQHEKVIYSVLYGGYDAGAVPLLDFENMEREGKVRREDYRIIATGEFVPYCTFSTSPDLPEKTRQALEQALLGLTKDATARVGGEVLRILERAGVDGYEKLDDADYEPIRRMAKRANMPPYQNF